MSKPATDILRAACKSNASEIAAAKTALAVCEAAYQRASETLERHQAIDKELEAAIKTLDPEAKK